MPERGIAQKVAKAAKAGGEVEGRGPKIAAKGKEMHWNLQGVECGTPISGRLLLRQVEIGAGAMSRVCHYLEDRRERERIKLGGEKNRLSLTGMCR